VLGVDVQPFRRGTLAVLADKSGLQSASSYNRVRQIELITRRLSFILAP
jgi:hypothetical protein